MFGCNSIKEVYFGTATNRRLPGASWSIIAPPFIPVVGARIRNAFSSRSPFSSQARIIATISSGFGQRRFHGSVAMLINEHTKSAAEMIADFAGTNQLATLVGTRTAGEVLGAVNFLVGEGYRLRIPIGGWMTWNDRLLEGTGVSPHVEASPSMTTLRAGQDVALQRAIDLF
jgi:C-terminal processing protease CtpA/Prc